MTDPVVLRVFIASPGDTLAVRLQVASVVEDINSDPLWRRHVRVELLRWDKPDDPIPVSFLRNPQHAVNNFVGDPAGCDLVVAFFRHRYGSPLPEKDFGRTPEGELWTGTSWELHRALFAASQKLLQDILIFRDTSPFSIPSGASRQKRETRSNSSML